MIKKVTISLVLLGVLGCSSTPKEPSVTNISPQKYKDYDCEQILNKTEDVLRRLGFLDIIYDRHKSNEIINRGIGAAIYWPLVFFPNGIGGSDHANYNDPRYPKLRGELIALKAVADQKQCDIDSFIVAYYEKEAASKESNKPDDNAEPWE